MYSKYSKKVFFVVYTFSFWFVALAIIVGFSACKSNKKVVENSNVFYTCSMHPQVMEAHPGKCPICGMNLIPVQKSNAPKPDEIQLSDQQMQLGNIKVDTIGRNVLGSETILTATLNYNQQQLVAVSSKVMGRVEKLYYKNIGEYIQKGEPLMEIYSEELNNAKQEYLLVLQRRKVLDTLLINFDQVIQSAKTKLLLWGMTESQINILAASNKTLPNTTVYSNESGYITELNVQEGGYISEGSTIVQLADLSTLWAEAQIYTSQFDQLNSSADVTVQLPQKNKELKGKLEFINPEINPDKRINLVRVVIHNQQNELKPGMIAYVVLNRRQHIVLSLPVGAVIRGENNTSVWVQTGRNTFKNKMVTTGIESGDRIEINSGLSQGEAVVTSGAYLINSEYIFRNGSSPMAGMKM